MSYPAVDNMNKALISIRAARSVICEPTIPGQSIYYDQGVVWQQPYGVGPVNGQFSILPYQYNLQINPNGQTISGIFPNGNHIPFVLSTDGSVIRNEFDIGPLSVEQGLLNWDINAADDWSEGLYLMGDANVGSVTYGLGPAELQLSALGVQSNTGIDWDQGAGFDVSAYLVNGEFSASNLGSGDTDSSASVGGSLGVGFGSPVGLNWADEDHDGFREYGFTLQLPVKPGFDVQLGYAGEDPLADLIAQTVPGSQYFLPDTNLTHAAGGGVVTAWDWSWEQGGNVVDLAGDGAGWVADQGGNVLESAGDGVGWLADHNPLPWP